MKNETKEDSFENDLLRPSSEEERRAIDDLFSLLYEELRSMASMVGRREAQATVRSTALLHESWMKVRNSPGLASRSPEHFKLILARAMRQVLVETARRREANKRGGKEIRYVELSEAAEREANNQACQEDSEMLAVDAALLELAKRSPRQARMVECRYFLGLTEAETAAALGVSESAVQRDWRAAKARLAAWVRPQLDAGTVHK